MSYTDRPGPREVGQRMTVRMHDPEGGYRDILGVLVTPTSIQKRDGSIVEFDPDRIALWRKIEPRTNRAGTGSPLSLRIQEIELAASHTWPAAEQVHLGDWVMRASGKFTMRANSVLALGDPGVGMDAALEEVVKFYGERTLVPTIHIALPTYVELDSLLAVKGWEEKMVVHVMVADIEEKALSNSAYGPWEVTNSPSDEWFALQRDEGAKEIMLRYPAFYTSLKVGDQIISVGRIAIFESWAILTRLFVAEEFRGKGLGKDLTTQLLNIAAQQGVAKAALQVHSKNTNAIGMYKGLGFNLHHAYKYRLLSSQPTKSEC